MNSRVVLVGLLAAAATACGDGGTEPELQVGSLSFAYSGAESGTFAVSGALDPDAGVPSSDGAVAVRYGEDAIMVVTGVRRRGASNADIVQIALPAITAPRTFTLDDECAPTSTILNCPFAIIGIDVPIQAPPPGSSVPEPPDGLYLFTSGSIVVTSVSATRITGTFQGSAETLGLDPLVPSQVIVVTNGRFDVPILSRER